MVPNLQGRTQKELVLSYLQKNGSITVLKARHLFRVERLAEVIRRLKADGHNIVNQLMTDETSRQYSNYVLKDGLQQELFPT